jgi:hypothetical protein
MHGVKVTGVRPENGVTPYYGTFIIVSVADPGCLSRIRLYPSRIPDPDADFLPIPDPGVKKALDPGSATLNCIKKGEGKYCGKNSPHRRSFVIRVRLHFNALKRKKHFETSLSFH